MNPFKYLLNENEISQVQEDDKQVKHFINNSINCECFRNKHCSSTGHPFNKTGLCNRFSIYSIVKCHLNALN